MDEKSSKEVVADGSDATYHKLKQWFVSGRTADYMAVSSIESTLRRTPYATTDVRGVQELILGIIKMMHELLLAAENTLDWAKLAMEKRDEENEKTLKALLEFVREYKVTLEEAKKDYGDKARRISKVR